MEGFLIIEGLKSFENSFNVSRDVKSICNGWRHSVGIIYPLGNFRSLCCPGYYL